METIPDTNNNGRFPKGTSGNPAGRPRGSRNKSTLLLEELLESQAERLTVKLIETALNGDTQALRMCMDRLVPPRRERTIHMELRQTEGKKDRPLTVQDIVRSVANGEITPGEGQQLSAILSSESRALSSDETIDRVEKMEERLNELRAYRQELASFIGDGKINLRREIAARALERADQAPGA